MIFLIELCLVCSQAVNVFTFFRTRLRTCLNPSLPSRTSTENDSLTYDCLLRRGVLRSVFLLFFEVVFEFCDVACFVFSSSVLDDVADESFVDEFCDEVVDCCSVKTCFLMR